MLVRQHNILTTHSFLDGMLVSFNFGYMLIMSTNIELSMKIGQLASHGFKLIVRKDDGNMESTCYICANDGLEMFEDVPVPHGIELTC